MAPELLRILALFPLAWKPDARHGSLTGTSGSPNDGRGADLTIFPCIWAHFCQSVALEDMRIARPMLAMVVAAAVVPQCAVE